MPITLYQLSSSLHKEAQRSPQDEPFIQEIEASLGERFEYSEDFSTFSSKEDKVIYVRTGGTEGLFKRLNLSGDIKFLTSGESNSLAASMEILSWLRSQGRHGRILHGSPSQIAAAIKEPIIEGTNKSFICPLDACDLGGVRLGVIGRPSDWLISSNVDYATARRILNAELVDIPMEELLGAIDSKGIDMRSFQGSVEVYNALKRIINKYHLGGLTLRCFDLLDTIHNTGCLALARLNAEGIPSSCEGDIPTLLSMAVLQKRYDCPGFQCNLSQINGDELLFAHCTVPLSMTENFTYATHFESGIGTAIKGEMRLGAVEIYKIAPDLERCVRIPGEIVRCESKPNLCRTQIIVHAKGAGEYLLREPLANHHVIRYT